MARTHKEMAAVLANVFANPTGFSFTMLHPVQGEILTTQTTVVYTSVLPPDDAALAGRMMEALMLMALGDAESPLQKSCGADGATDEFVGAAVFGGISNTSTADIVNYLDPTGASIRFEHVHKLIGCLAASSVNVMIKSPTRVWSNGNHMSFMSLSGSIVRGDAVIVLEYMLNPVLWNIVQL